MNRNKYTVLLFLGLLLPLPASSQVIKDSVYGVSLTNNVTGEPAEREVLVYLPPGYNQSAERYPVVYLLHAFGAGPSSWLGEDGYEGMNIRLVLDSLVNHQIIDPLIVAMPDAQTKFGGSWYVNSVSGGNWLDFISGDLVQYMDSTYRTIAERKARGITGQSMGGYGALYIAMNRPQVFGSVLTISPPNLVNPDPFGEAFYPLVLEVSEHNLESAHIIGRLFWSRAVAFSPDVKAPPFYGILPFNKKGDEFVRNEEPWQKWLDYALNNRVQEFQESLDQLSLRIEVGKEDGLLKDIRTFSYTLDSLNIQHEFEMFEGDHTMGVRHQFENSVFLFFDDHFRKE